ncbi:hypothetical protein BSKO_10443 [Bryopsis sp. KO-2023]|nr:hypothetical protein BSKO_10443 [Bryopsis sp. KO-2023]
MEIRKLAPAEEVDPDEVKYELRALKSPVLNGWKFKLMLSFSRSPFFFLLRNKVVKDSGIPQALQWTEIPELPLFTSTPFFDYSGEEGATVIDPNKGASARLDASIQHILGFKTTPTSHEKSEKNRVTIKDYHRAYTNGDCSPLDVAQRIIRVLSDWEKSGRSLAWFISWDENEIIRQATESTDRYQRGKPLSVLDGVPFSVKDSMDALPYKSTAGTAFLSESRRANRDSSSVASLKAVGAVLLGKANMHEIGLGVTGANVNYGTPVNAWGQNRYPGGSSSGSGASVGAGLCPFSIGADGGGSIRVPSSFNGCVGLKTTAERVPHDNSVQGEFSVGVYGPIAGCVEDAMVLYSMMAAKGSTSGSTPPLALPTLDPNPGPKPLAGLKMGIYTEWFEHSVVEVVDACKKAVTFLEALGVELVQIKIPDLELMRISHTVTITSEMLNCYRLAVEDKKTFRRMTADVQLSLAFTKDNLALEYVQAQRIRRRMSVHFKKILENVDFIVTPSTPITAPKFQAASVKSPGETNVGLTSRIMRFVFPANSLGLPAISLPVGKDSEGMPIGFQIMGKHWQEATLLKAAYHLERMIHENGKNCDNPNLLINPLKPT